MYSGQDPRKYISYCLFTKIDNISSDIKKDKAEFLVGVLRKVLLEIEGMKLKNLEWWRGELLLRIARLSEKYVVVRDEKFKAWNQVFDIGKQTDNSYAMIESGHYLAFQYVEFFSMKGLGEMQFRVIGKLRLSENLDKLKKFGEDMYIVWRSLNWKKLSEHDIKTKKLLLESARELKAKGFEDGEAGPVMILLLSNLYNFRADILAWAIEELNKNKTLDKIPRDVKIKIEHYFNNADRK